MIKKLCLLLTAGAVVAFAVPAVAGAATGLTEEAGGLVPTGKILTGKNVGPLVIESTKTGNLSCASGTWMVEAKLTTNTSAKVVAEEGGKTTYIAICTDPTGSPVFKNIGIIKFDTTGAAPERRVSGSSLNSALGGRFARIRRPMTRLPIERLKPPRVERSSRSKRVR